MVRSDGRCYTALVECAANFKGLVRGSLGFSACASCEKINFVLEINKEVRPGEPGCFFATCLRTDLHNAWYIVQYAHPMLRRIGVVLIYIFATM